MLRKPLHLALGALALGAAPLAAQSHEGHTGHASHSDSLFAALQRRGAGVMGVDQYASAHRFEPLPDGGRIELQMLADDTAGARTIREHLRAQAAAFARGDFGNPVLVHGVAAPAEVPGAVVLTRKRAALTYTVRDLPRGAELRIATRDGEALAAVHEFLAWQRRDHRTGR